VPNVDEIPAIGVPMSVRGRRDLAVVLDEFAPTHLDVWTGRAVVVPSGVQGVPSDAPSLLSGDSEGALVARAVIVRHSGAISGRRPLLGVRRRRLDALLTMDPPEAPVLGVIVDSGSVSAVWVRGTPQDLATTLSNPAWRSMVG